jgi:hypothetical protein
MKTNKTNIGKSSTSGGIQAKLYGTRSVGIVWKLKNALTPRFIKSWLMTKVAKVAEKFGLLTAYAELEAVKISLSDDDKHYFQFLMKKADELENTAERNDAIMEAQKWAWLHGMKINYGVVSRRVVTNAFVAFVVDQLQTETSVFGDFKYHDSGVGTTAEAAGDTAIETTDGESRATGTQTESAANAYRSVGTISYTTTKAITEHGLFNDPTAGTLMDRSVFSAINVVNGDSIQFTYTITFTAGG